MTELLFGVLLQGFTFWNTKNGQKYSKQVLNLRQEWLAQYNLPRSRRDNQTLDEIETQLYLISKIFITGEQK